MANLWCDGFGRYGGTTSYMLNGSSGSAWAQIHAWILSTSNPRTGTHCLMIPGDAGATTARRVLGGMKTEVFFGQALHFEELPEADDGFILASFRSQGNATHVDVFLGADGSVYVKGPGGTILDRTEPIVGAGAYQHFEHYLKIGNADGAYELRVDEVTRLNLTGIDTDSGSGEVSQIAVGATGLVGDVVGVVYMADVYANDTVDDGSGCHTFIGDCKSGVLMVNADTAQADFTLSAGVSGYALLDETGPDDADYIYTSATAAESDFGFADTPANLTEVLTARPFVRAWKDDAGTATVAPSMKSNGVKATSGDQPIATAPTYYDKNVPLNPDTGAPWTKAEIDAALHVVERTT